MADGPTLYVARTPTGAKVEYRDYSGLSDGLFSKGYTRYFYGDEPEAQALEAALRKADGRDDYNVEVAHNISAEVVGDG